MTSGAFSLRIWCDQPSPIVVNHWRRLWKAAWCTTLSTCSGEKCTNLGFSDQPAEFRHTNIQRNRILKTTRWCSSYKEPMYSMYVLNLPRTHLFHPKPLKERGYLCVHIYIIWYMDTYMHIVWKAWCHAPVQMSEASGMHFCRQETLQIRRSVFSHPHDVLFQT